MEPEGYETLEAVVADLHLWITAVEDYTDLATAVAEYVETVLDQEGYDLDDWYGRETITAAYTQRYGATVRAE